MSDVASAVPPPRKKRNVCHSSEESTPIDDKGTSCGVTEEEDPHSICLRDREVEVAD